MDTPQQPAQDQQYTRGFNDGYLLAKHEPQLAAQLTAQPNDHNDYFAGLVGGKQEYEKEVREWSKSFSKGGPAKDDRSIDRETR
jgi:hypothetical protein